jgi:hypothetical protein
MPNGTFLLLLERYKHAARCIGGGGGWHCVGIVCNFGSPTRVCVSTKDVSRGGCERHRGADSLAVAGRSLWTAPSDRARCPGSGGRALRPTPADGGSTRSAQSPPDEREE